MYANYTDWLANLKLHSCKPGWCGHGKRQTHLKLVSRKFITQIGPGEDDSALDGGAEVAPGEELGDPGFNTCKSPLPAVVAWSFNLNSTHGSSWVRNGDHTPKWHK